jgi:hypothetical protein
VVYRERAFMACTEHAWWASQKFEVRKHQGRS